jgi:hypothetical protein
MREISLLLAVCLLQLTVMPSANAGCYELLKRRFELHRAIFPFENKSAKKNGVLLNGISKSTEVRRSFEKHFRGNVIEIGSRQFAKSLLDNPNLAEALESEEVEFLRVYVAGLEVGYDSDVSTSNPDNVDLIKYIAHMVRPPAAMVQLIMNQSFTKLMRNLAMYNSNPGDLYPDANLKLIRLLALEDANSPRARRVFARYFELYRPLLMNLSHAEKLDAFLATNTDRLKQLPAGAMLPSQFQVVAAYNKVANAANVLQRYNLLPAQP